MRRNGLKIGRAVLACTVIVLLGAGVYIAVQHFILSRVTLQVLCPSSEQELLQRIVEDGMEINGKSITFEWTAYGGDLSKEELESSKADLVFFLGKSSGEVEEWSDILTSLDNLMEDVQESLILSNVQEETYILPLSGEAPVILYNKKIFAQLGLPRPDNLNNLFDICNILKSNDIPVLGIPADDSREWDIESLADCILVNSAEYPANISDEDTSFGYEDLNIVADSLKDKLSVMAHNDDSELKPGRLDEKYAMVLGTTTDLGAMESDDVWGCCPLYGMSPYNYIPWRTELSAAVPKKAHHKALTQEVLKQLLSTEKQSVINRDSQKIPVVKNVSVLNIQAEIYRTMSYPMTTVYSFFDDFSDGDKEKYLNEIQQIFQNP